MELELDSDTEKNSSGRLSTLVEGAKGAWPICLGYFPIGLALGVLGQKAGIHPLAIGLMSILLFAGSAQLIAVSMLSTGAAPMSIIATTLIVNLRHVLMSSSLAVYLGGRSGKFLSLFAYGITDESFAVNTMHFRDGDWSGERALVVNHVSNAVWVLSTILGGYGGQFIPQGSFGIDYALSAMFLSLLIFQLRGRIYIITGLVAGVLAVVFSLLLPGNSYIVLASLAAATIGFFLRRSARKEMPC
ncbi:MAG: AzlC family ABC transporter permease [Acidobacteriota bacterium]